MAAVSPFSFCFVVVVVLENLMYSYVLQFQTVDYYTNAMKQGLGPDSDIPCMFTACGPPRLKMGKYNVPVGLYSDETILELGSSSNHGFVE
jgi:hypothetical protein